MYSRSIPCLSRLLLTEYRLVLSKSQYWIGQDSCIRRLCFSWKVVLNYCNPRWTAEYSVQCRCPIVSSPLPLAVCRQDRVYRSYTAARSSPVSKSDVIRLYRLIQPCALSHCHYMARFPDPARADEVWESMWDITAKLILNPNFAKSHSFAHNFSVILPCSVQTGCYGRNREYLEGIKHPSTCAAELDKYLC